MLQVLGLLVRYALQADMGVAAHGIALLQAVITQQAPLLQPLGWSCALKALSMAAASDALQLTALAGHSPSDRCPACLPLTYEPRICYVCLWLP